MLRKRALPCAVLAAFIAVSGAGQTAPRDVTMRVRITNKSGQSLAPKSKTFTWGGSIACEPARLHVLKKGSRQNIRCVTSPSQPDGSRNVRLTVHYLLRQQLVAELVLSVYESTHNFQCNRDCKLTERWNCRDTGPCAVDVDVTLGK
jgi:hypothetical protein